MGYETQWRETSHSLHQGHSRIRKKNRPLFAEDFYTLDDKVNEIVKETDRLRRRIERLETKRAELRKNLTSDGSV